MEAYKREFLAFLEEAGVLRFGDFTAKSGRRIPYFLNAGEVKTGRGIARLGEFYARAYREKLGDTPAALFGPAYKGIPLVTAAAAALGREGLDLPFFFNRKEAKDHGEGGTLVGYVPKAGDEVVIIEDVITAGTAIRESMALLGALEGVRVVAAFVMVDRRERGQGPKAATTEVRETYGFPVYAVADVYDILEYLDEKPEQRENAERIRTYLGEWGERA